jgi:hypothetical protein
MTEETARLFLIEIAAIRKTIAEIQCTLGSMTQSTEARRERSRKSYERLIEAMSRLNIKGLPA